MGCSLLVLCCFHLQLNGANERIVGYEQDAESHKLVVADCARLNAELEAANAEKDRLCGTFSCVWSLYLKFS
jgi:hypothetical protein